MFLLALFALLALLLLLLLLFLLLALFFLYGWRTTITTTFALKWVFLRNAYDIL